MEEAKLAGLTRSIGISNSGTPEIEEILSIAQIVPAVNQVRAIPQNQLLSSNRRWGQRRSSYTCTSYRFTSQRTS